MSTSGVATTSHQLSLPIEWKTRSQDRHDPLSIIPAHLLDQLDTCDQVACAAGAEEEAVMADEVSRHCHGFLICDPVK